MRLAAVVALCGVVMLSLGMFDGAEPAASAALDSTPSPSTDAALRTGIDPRTEVPVPAAGRNASELRLHGVMLTGAPGEAMAMISAGQGTARTVALGATVIPGMVLQSIAPDQVAIGPPGGAAAIVLSAQALAVTTQAAGAAFATEPAVPSGMNTGVDLESSVQGNTGARSVIHPRRSRLHGIAVSR